MCGTVDGRDVYEVRFARCRRSVSETPAQKRSIQTGLWPRRAPRVCDDTDMACRLRCRRSHKALSMSAFNVTFRTTRWKRFFKRNEVKARCSVDSFYGRLQVLHIVRRNIFERTACIPSCGQMLEKTHIRATSFSA